MDNAGWHAQRRAAKVFFSALRQSCYWSSGPGILVLWPSWTSRADGALHWRFRQSSALSRSTANPAERWLVCAPTTYWRVTRRRTFPSSRSHASPSISTSIPAYNCDRSALTVHRCRTVSEVSSCPNGSSSTGTLYTCFMLATILIRNIVHVWTVTQVGFSCGKKMAFFDIFPRFDTIDSQQTWLGAALIVTADSGSIYQPPPMLSYHWDPDKTTATTLSSGERGYPASDRSSSSSPQNGNGQLSFNLGPHPADPHSTGHPGSPISVSTSTSMMASMPGPNFRKKDAYGQDIWFYTGPGAYVTLISVPTFVN